MTAHRGFLALVACVVFASGARAASCRAPSPVHFAPGATSAELTGGVPRGERDCYTLAALGGQRLAVTQPGRDETNIVLQLYRPPWRIATSAGATTVTGRALPGAGERADARGWSGVLPVSGTYLLVLGTSWGSGEYRVRIAIR